MIEAIEDADQKRKGMRDVNESVPEKGAKVTAGVGSTGRGPAPSAGMFSLVFAFGLRASISASRTVSGMASDEIVTKDSVSGSK